MVDRLGAPRLRSLAAMLQEAVTARPSCTSVVGWWVTFVGAAGRERG